MTECAAMAWLIAGLLVFVTAILVGLYVWEGRMLRKDDDDDDA